jgi:hypothetical protein
VSPASKKRKKILAAVLYLLSALALAFYFDSLYGAGGPDAHYIDAIYLGMASAIFFAVACSLSLFSARMGLLAGIVACVLSWPFLGIGLLTFPWRALPGVVRFSLWGPILKALLMLIVANAYSVTEVKRLWAK